MARISFRRGGLLAFLLFFGLACNLLTPTTPVAPTQPALEEFSPLDETDLEDAAATEEALQDVEALPTSTAVVEEAGGIQIEYVYTDGLVTALYHLYGTVLDHFVDVSLTNTGSETVTLVVETDIEGYTTTASDTVYVDAGATEVIHQDPRLTQESVDRLNNVQPGNFRIRIRQIDPGDDQLLLDETQQILLYSRRDFVWIDGFETQEEYELWAAWVTPTDPEVEALIRAAADYIEGGIMWSGYGDHVDDDDGGVWDRLEAIWDAEKNVYALTYVSTMLTFGPNSVQRMRLPAEVLDQHAGNCIELVTLYASAAEAMSLETAIIRIPGHAYLAVRTDQVNANYYFVETTMIGQSSFAEAIDVGNRSWEDTLPHLEAGDEGYAWVKVRESWEKGILPIPWK